MYGKATPENIEKYIELFVKPRQVERQIAAYNPGGITINSSEEILKNIFKK